MRPAGVPESGPVAELAKKASRVPRTPRFVTALLLLASILIIATPELRRAMHATADTWRDGSLYTMQAAKLQRLHAEASRKHDPQLLALVALVTWDDNNERMRAANEAVRLDPSLTWIYSKIRLREEPCCMLHPLDEDGIAALQKWDPQNAFPRLLAADMIYERAEKAWADGGSHGTYLDVENLIEHDPQWLAAMDFAFQAPKYDSYSAGLFSLYRTLAARYDIGEPEFALEVLWHSWDWGWNRDANIYDGWLLKQGDAAERAGRLDDAAAFYWKPVLFAERVQGQDRIEGILLNWNLANVQKESYGKLQPLLTKMGRTDESALIGYNLEGLQANVQERNWQYSERWSWVRNGWAGFLIRFLTGAIVLLGALSLVAITTLFFRRHASVESRGWSLAFFSLAVDACPVLLLIGAGMLYATYRPITLVFERYMSAPYPVSDVTDLQMLLQVPYTMPEGLANFSHDYLNAYHYWIVAIVGLSMIAFYILLRGKLQRRPAVS
jgi:hypothetical protein